MDEAEVRNISLALLGLVAVVAIIGLVLLFKGMSSTGDVALSARSPIGECYRMDTNGTYTRSMPIYSTDELQRVQNVGYALGDCHLYS